MRFGLSWLALPSVFVLTLVPATAAANGLYTHAHISRLAHQALPPGALGGLFEDPEMVAAYEAGSIFPDSGYAVEPRYGEVPHWEPFIIDFVRSIQRRYGGDYTSRDARLEIAFLLGVASHGLADQSYDTTLLARTAELEPEDDAVPYDTYADYFLTVDQGVRFQVEPWAPWAELPELFEGTGVSPNEADLMEGMRLAGVATNLQSDLNVAEPGWDLAWQHYPYLGTYLYDDAVVGSLPWLGELVARYWEVLYERILGIADVDEALLLDTVPPDGGENWPVSADASASLFRIGVWFGWGMPSDETRLAMRMEDADGVEVPVHFETAYNGRDRSLIFVVPEGDLVYDTVYTVEVGAGVRTLSDDVTSRPQLFSFRTRCAPDSLSDCPALEAPRASGEQPPRPPRPRRDAGPAPDAGTEPTTTDGCGVGRAPRSGASAALWVAALLAFVRRR